MTATQARTAPAAATVDPPAAATVDPPAARRRRLVTVAAGAAILPTAVAAFAGWRWHSTSDQLAALRDSASDETAATQLAIDYATRSLTYDYRTLDAFFAGVTQDASPALVDRYNAVHDTLAAIMNESQVVANGEVVSAAVDSVASEQYAITVFATQRTQNVQQPDPGNVPNLLSVTVTKVDDGWQITDYGPKK